MASAMKTVAEEVAELRANPKYSLDRRKNRPISNGVARIHVKELLALIVKRTPKGMDIRLNQSISFTYPYSEFLFRRNWQVSALKPYQETALSMTYFDYFYVNNNHDGWIIDDRDLNDKIKMLDDLFANHRKNLFEAYRNQIKYQMNTVESKKGKPRRVVKKGNFEDFYRKLASTKFADGYVIDLMPTVPATGDASRTWGIEIEVAGARGVSAPSGWDWTEDGSLRSPYASSECNCDCTSCSEWEEHDCGDDDCGGTIQDDDSKEFVSPILTGIYAPGIQQICNDVRFEPQNDTAGVHVHVGTDGITPRQIGGLVYAYGLLERMLNQSYRRNDREYCAGLTPDDVRAVLGKARTAKRKAELDVIDRYVTVNVQALYKHGTIEFRAMGPVYEAEYLHKWAMFCREMVNVAAKDVPQRRWNAVKTFEDVLQIFRDYGTEVNMVEARQKALVAA